MSLLRFLLRFSAGDPPLCLKQVDCLHFADHWADQTLAEKALSQMWLWWYLIPSMHLAVSHRSFHVLWSTNNANCAMALPDIKRGGGGENIPQCSCRSSMWSAQWSKGSKKDMRRGVLWHDRYRSLVLFFYISRNEKGVKPPSHPQACPFAGSCADVYGQSPGHRMLSSVYLYHTVYIRV